MLYNREPVPVVDFVTWFANDSASKLYTAIICSANFRKQDEAFERLTKLNIVREHKGMLHLDDNFRKQFKSALTGGQSPT